MITTIFNNLVNGSSRTVSNRTRSSCNGRRANRQFSPCQGIETLEGRLAPSGGIAPITITVTNQSDQTPGTDTMIPVTQFTVS